MTIHLHKAEVKNKQSHNSILPTRLYSVHRDNFTFADNIMALSSPRHYPIILLEKVG